MFPKSEASLAPLLFLFKIPKVPKQQTIYIPQRTLITHENRLGNPTNWKI